MRDITLFIKPFLRSRSGLSAYSIRAYTYALELLAVINPDAPDDLIPALRERGLAPVSVATVVRHVRVFLRWCIARKHDIGEWEHWRPKLAKRKNEPKAVETAAINQMLEEANTRDRAIILLLQCTGIRAGSAVSLKWTELNLEQRRGLIHTKGGRIQRVYFNQECADALRAWKEHAPPCEQVFDLSYWGMREVLRRLVKKSNIKTRVTLHGLRHAFAKQSLAKGTDLATVSQLMGHSSVSVTADNYAVWASSELENVYRRLWD